MLNNTDPNQRLSQYLENGTQALRESLKINVVSGNERELDRMERYYLNWHFYEGRHFRDYNDTMLSFNYVRAIIDKVNQFLIGDTGFSFKVTTYYNDVVSIELEKQVEESIMYHWRRSNKLHVLSKMLQMGGICGDVWVMPYWDEDKRHVNFRVFDSRQVYVEFDKQDTNKVKSILIRQTVAGKDGGRTNLRVTRYLKEQIQSWDQEGSSYITDPGQNGYLTSVDDRIVGKKVDTKSNPLNIIPIVHIQNKINSSGYYGKSDAHDILKLNKVFNELNQELKSIIDYHATPVTIVKGANIKNMKRGLGQVWSGLPPESDVYNLGLDADISGISSVIKDIKNYMHEISDVPENVLGKIQSISGTSAAALKLTYQPLVQQADIKATTYGEGISEINELVFKILDVYDKNNPRIVKLKKELADNDLSIDDIRVEPIFAYGFPTDKLIQLQELQIESQLKVVSRREMMNRLGKNNVTDLLMEIDEEEMARAQMDAEKNTIINPQPQQIPT